jgi:hypothetical protein
VSRGGTCRAASKRGASSSSASASTCETRRVQLVREGGTRRVQLVREGGGGGREGGLLYPGGARREKHKNTKNATVRRYFSAAAPASPLPAPPLCSATPLQLQRGGGRGREGE